MRKSVLRTAVAALALVVASGAAAKTLVFCSEGSPENFNPQLYTSGTSVDASAVPVYNRLVDFKVGTTELIPSLAESWDISPDGKTYTLCQQSVDLSSIRWCSRKQVENLLAVR